MGTRNTLHIPPVGWRSVDKLCPECLLIVAKTIEIRGAVPGQQADCYVCKNRLTAVRTEGIGDSAFERDVSRFGYENGGEDPRVVEVMFNRSGGVRESEMERWLAERDLSSFEKVGRLGVDWTVFKGKEDTEARVLVLLDKGVIGRCLLKDY